MLEMLYTVCKQNEVIILIVIDVIIMNFKGLFYGVIYQILH